MIHIAQFSEMMKEETHPNAERQIDEIFFESSSRSSFESESEKQEFKYKYLDWYKKYFPELIWVAVNSDLNILGYICGASDTISAPELAQMHPWMTCIREHLKNYPAHLHINLSQQARGQGVGSLLLSQFENNLKSQNISGVHLVTSPVARNVGFYRKNRYTFEAKFTWKNVDLLLMGKHLR